MEFAYSTCIRDGRWSALFCVHMYFMLYQTEAERECRRVNLTRLSFPQPFYMQLHSSSNREQSSLSPITIKSYCCLAACTYMCGHNRFLSLRVFPLILSSKQFSYGKLITDWLQSCLFNKSWTSLRFCIEKLIGMGLRTIRMLSSMCIPEFSNQQGLQSRLWEPERALELFEFLGNGRISIFPESQSVAQSVLWEKYMAIYYLFEFHTSIYIFCIHLFFCGLWGNWCLTPAVIVWEAGRLFPGLVTRLSLGHIETNNTIYTLIHT